MRYKAESIRDIGLRPFLDVNKEKHNGFGYDKFLLFVNSGVNVTNLARTFNVSRNTMDNWMHIYREESDKNKAISDKVANDE